MSVDLILYVVAFICFLLAGLGVPVARVNLPWLGVACLVLTLIV